MAMTENSVEHRFSYPVRLFLWTLFLMVIASCTTILIALWILWMFTPMF